MLHNYPCVCVWGGVYMCVVRTLNIYSLRKLQVKIQNITYSQQAIH